MAGGSGAEAGSMAGSRKKVIVRFWNAPRLAGYLPGASVVGGDGGTIELLDAAGRLVTLEVAEIRYVAYVRDFNLDDAEDPERLVRRTFMARPRSEGLWVRLTFRDGESLEGLAPLDMSLLDDAIADAGLYLVPPDVRSNTQRLYVPRASLSGLQLVGVVTTPSKAAASESKGRGGRDEGPLLPFPEPRGQA